VSPTTPCVEYDGFRNANGYGRVNKRVGGKLVSEYVHRLVWEATNGPIPPGMLVMHLCDNPPCYRLDHLRLGTPADNMADMKAKGRARTRPNAPQHAPALKPGRLGDRDHCKHGHPFTPENTCVDPRGWRSCRICRRASDRRRRANGRHLPGLVG
jgi:hypothetical protein